jgi:acyl-CoA hydrolase
MDNLTFQSESHEGDAVNVMAQATRAFNSSVEVLVLVTSEETGSVICSAFFVFVSFKDGKKVSLPTTIPETELEQLHFLSAADRRSARMNAKQLLKDAKESIGIDEALEDVGDDTEFAVRATVSSVSVYV